MSTPRLDQIAESIRESRSLGLSDEDITKTFIDPDTHQSTLSFGECSYIDCVLAGDDTHRGFWRSAYGYPVENQDIVYRGGDVRPVSGKAKDVGLFTFNIDVSSDIRDFVSQSCGVCECSKK